MANIDVKKGQQSEGKFRNSIQSCSGIRGLHQEYEKGFNCGRQKNVRVYLLFKNKIFRVSVFGIGFRV